MKTIFKLFFAILIVTHTHYAQILQKKDTVKVNGIDLYYEIYGSGEPLMLLHGWTQSSQAGADYIEEYANHFERGLSHKYYDLIGGQILFGYNGTYWTAPFSDKRVKLNTGHPIPFF